VKLEGLRVVDLSLYLPGPQLTLMFADHGAEVIKVEPPGGDQSRRIGPAKGDVSAMFASVNRGKRSIVLDLKRAAHLQVLHDLLARTDVLVENFRPGAMQRLGLGADALCAAYPRLVVASITGFGPSGPHAQARVYDAVIQAVSGISVSHPSQATGEPTLLATTVCDKLTALTAAQAISAALLARERSGAGMRLQVAMLDAALAFNWPDAMNNLTFMHEPPAPFPEFGIHQRPYRTRDGHVATMTPQPDEFAALCKGLGRPDIAADPRFATANARRHNVTELLPVLQALFEQHDSAELVSTLAAAGVPIGRVNQRHEVLTDPQVRHNQALAEVAHGQGIGAVRLARSAARFGPGEPAAPLPGAAPRLGEHAAQLLSELGYDAPRIAELLAPTA
jgi:crotonobetainyl-CoA:carnitine CoA-transferase CaiB-like acyl-CoA transferase